MTTLTPLQAAHIARGVYTLLDQTVGEARERGDLFGCEGLFTVGEESRFTGRSGGLIACKTLSGFGYLAEGEGRHQGEILVATRGTSIKLDWLSNLNLGMQIGPGGLPVHAGFHEVWKSFADGLAQYLRGRNPSVIHCVGHSLGGALATLNADYFSHIRAGAVRLYTFGSPRAGSLFFSNALRQRLGAEHIHRVHHASDPVPKIPLFPFLHVPADSAGYPLASGNHGLVSVAAHSMKDSYIPGVGEDNWVGLERRCRDDLNEARVQGWLDQIASGGGHVLPFGARMLQMIGRALAWLLKKTSALLVGTFGTLLTAGMTVLDQLAWLLAKSAELSIELTGYIAALVKAIFLFLGRTAIVGTVMTFGFVRWVLGLLFGTLTGLARSALSVLG